MFTDEHLTAKQPVLVLATVRADCAAALVEFNGEDDHVHLLVEYPPMVQLSKLVNSLKGVLSRRLRQRFRMRTHRDHPWVAVVLRRIMRRSPARDHPPVRRAATAAGLSVVPGSTASGGIGYPGRERPGLRR